MDAFVVVGLYPSGKHIVGIVQVSKGIVLADGPLDDTVIALNVGVLFRHCRTSKLMVNAVGLDVFTQVMGDKLAAIVALYGDLGDHGYREPDVVK